ncbi:Hypothetical protein R9X50_00668400 [Acrodontium crateriforme]|uniref:Sulfhydryl oxidase n=1 Tax=Acrodontium crateriforme TaxID=150365 RepID=A0AAQ3R6Z4_9PEZI|nr:Hypothetical protein R9X50_00668400 [Acrodontium crateriforme]
MPVARGPTPRFIFILLGAVLTGIFFLSSIHKSTPSAHQTSTSIPTKQFDASVDRSLLTGHVIAPKLGNETAKAELGRAAWKYFHTVMARFPDEPTADESSALKSYVYLFQRLYPCGECAEHFGELLKEFPPQTSSRSAAAVWACHVHNQVNKSLNKEIFDCANIGDFYDCGCADDETDGSGKKKVN